MEYILIRFISCIEKSVYSRKNKNCIILFRISSLKIEASRPNPLVLLQLKSSFELKFKSPECERCMTCHNSLQNLTLAATWGRVLSSKSSGQAFRLFLVYLDAMHSSIALVVVDKILHRWLRLVLAAHSTSQPYDPVQQFLALMF